MPQNLRNQPGHPGVLQLFRDAVALGASDLHFEGPSSSGPGRLWLRLHGELRNPEGAGPEPEVLAALDEWIASALEGAGEGRDADFSFAIPGSARFRAHLYRLSGYMGRGWGAVFRVIAETPPTLEQLRLPSLLSRIPALQRGLVLVTGATGSGKSSTLAALIHEINRSRSGHIVTIEDPIEFVHGPIQSRISQREVGTDTGGFADALRSALREDPDVILVGEMRDPETVSVALKAAETGHLVLSTVHTQDAVRTVGRLIALFPPEEQRLVRLRLADNLSAIVSQRLVASASGGRVAAMEIVLATQSVRDCVGSPERTDEMIELVQKSGDGQGFDRHLVELYLAGKITLETAKESATRPADLERELRFGAMAGGKLPPEPGIVLAGASAEPGSREKQKQDPGQTPDPALEKNQSGNPFDALKSKRTQR
jgi:twitching motility protein PilT